MPQFQHGRGKGGGRPASDPGKIEKLTQPKGQKQQPKQQPKRDEKKRER